MFRKAQHHRTHEDLVSQIQSQILDGELKPGDRLPSERQLGEVFGVSRGTLREALRVLEKKGLIKVKVGVRGGAFVRAADDAAMTEDLDILLRLKKISLTELLEFRESIEGTVAIKAAKNATAEDVAHLRSILDSMKALLSQEDHVPEDVVRLDISFHLYLAQISGNRLFACILSTVWGNTNWYYDIIRDRAYQQKNYEDLCQILAVFEQKNFNELKRLAERHVSLYIAHIEKIPTTSFEPSDLGGMVRRKQEQAVAVGGSIEIRYR